MLSKIRFHFQHLPNSQGHWNLFYEEVRTETICWQHKPTELWGGPILGRGPYWASLLHISRKATSPRGVTTQKNKIDRPCSVYVLPTAVCILLTPFAEWTFDASKCVVLKIKKCRRSLAHSSRLSAVGMIHDMRPFSLLLNDIFGL
jgi:hypothetical protein